MTITTRISKALDERTVAALRVAIDAGDFPGISFEQAMQFVLMDGIVPASGLPVKSFLRLEDWIRARMK